MTAYESTSTSPTRVVLHIGLLGAGGAYLRSVLDANATAITAAGVEVITVGEDAVRDAVAPRREADESSGAWQRLVEETGAATGPVRLLSADLLSTAPDNVARAIVASFAPHRVDVVVTVQDMARTVPSAWQHAVTHGRKITFADYASAAVGAANDRPTKEQLGKQHDVVAILQRWSTVVGAARLHLVTVPPPGATGGLLWERFAQAFGLGPDVVAADSVEDYTDGQLAFSETELLRRLNRRVGDELVPANYDRYLRGVLAGEIMQPLGDAAPTDRPALDAKGLRWATERGRQIAAELTPLGIDVVGDLTDLMPAAGSAGGASTPTATYPDPAVRAVAMLLRKLVDIDPAAAPKLEKSAQRRRGPRGAGRSPRRADA